MTRADLLALAERAERAEASEAAQIIREAVLLCGKEEALTLLAVGALLDAALSLVPEGWHLAIEPIFFEDGRRVAYDAFCVKPPWAAWRPHDPQSRHDKVQIAAVAAALRARAEEAKDGE
jgi:hypothetical protein